MVCNFGTVLLCPQNLAVSGANQVLYNIVAGNLYRGNVVLCSPVSGPFAAKFQDLGVSVRIGRLQDVLEALRDVRFAICNTIMTAHIVNDLNARGVPCAWVLHEWWTKEMISVELDKRNDKNLTGATVERALACAATVSVCRRQQELYGPANGEVIFVGTPDVDPALFRASVPACPQASPRPLESSSAVAGKVLTFLCLGIVCPRKNQEFTVRCFKAFAGTRKDIRLVVVGVRRIRDYEIAYVEKVEEAIAGDERIQLLDVTHEVDEHYASADVVLLASLNEVTPMVLAEAMARGKPVMTTGIAGIPEMVENGVEGFICGEEDTPETVAEWAGKMQELADGPLLRQRMGKAGLKRYESQFRLQHMVDLYRKLALRLAKPVVLVDMDGCLVDWDRGFLDAWAGRTPVDRSHYEMEKCVPAERYTEAVDIFCSKGFFQGLPAMAGGLDALRAMLARGFDVLICTSPVAGSRYCAQEKWEWVRENLGEDWLQQLVLTMDKTSVRGDVLIDDKPKISGSQQPTWTQVLFDAPYNRNIEMGSRRRLQRWADWEVVLMDELSIAECESDAELGETASGVAASTPPRSLQQSSANNISSTSVSSISAEEVAQLRDFTVELKCTSYRKDYALWRQGRAQGAKGEVEQAVAEIERIQKQVFLEGDDWSSVHVYRTMYQDWRRGNARGAKDSKIGVSA